MAQPRIKAIIWDAGLVMFFWPKGHDWDYFWSRVARVRPFFDRQSLEESIAIITDVQRRFETGELTVDGHRLALSETFGLDEPLTWDEYRLAVIDGVGYTLNRTVLEVQSELARSCLEQGLISNLCPVMRDVLTRAGAFSHLYPQLFSYEQRLMKPSEILLERALAYYRARGCRAENVLVIDDNAANIAVAAKAGCHVHQYDNDLALGLAMHELGLPAFALTPFLQGEARGPLPIRWEPPLP